MIDMKTVFLICFLALAGAGYGQDPAYQLPASDVESVDAIITSLYDVISGPAGEKRNWARFKALFAPGARIVPVSKGRDGAVTMRPLTIDEYVERAATSFEANGFFEEEIGRKTDAFGYVTHVFSTYISRRTDDGEIFARGINSIQLAQVDGRYWIVNLTFSPESEEHPIPRKYLKDR